ncbi:hypothetical protein GGX14DRAFT_581925 [Mycena pura]|uniref:DUF6534 domain-containing protein n=1 Tax=Mycena pura TaxID=153505 RepID=A0AAD6YUH7_9AGAR|nr:hypothetical protein GGX14DRAFT_581925 [Mycena pura]
MLIGVLLNTTLYGLFIYYKRYKRDRNWFRYLALFLLIVETVDVVLDINLIYEPLVSRWGTELCALRSAASPDIQPGNPTALVAISTPIQLFVAWRIKILTQSYVFPALITLLALISFGGGLLVTIQVSLHPDYADFAHFRPFVITWLAASAVCDLVLSAALIYTLRSRKGGARTTDQHLDRIIRLTVQTGSISTVAALLDLFFFLFSPVSHNFIWDFPLSKLYSNALLSTSGFFCPSSIANN